MRRVRPDAGQVFAALRGVLAPLAPTLVVRTDTPTEYHLDTPPLPPSGQPQFFGSVRAGASGVALHLMPLYLEPALLDGLSAALRARLTGKSCFRFRTLDEPLLAEVEALAHTGHSLYAERGWLARGC